MNKAMKQMNPDELKNAAYHIGRVLADIHRYQFDKPGFFGEGLKIVESVVVSGDMFRSFMEESLYRGKAGEWLGEEKTEQFWRFVNKNAKLLEEPPNHFSLTHSDFNPWNLLIDEKMNVAAVLDWEFAFSASPVHDIGNMLRFEPDDSPFEKRFIEGFAAGGGELPEEWRKLSKLNDLIALVDLLNRSDSGENRISDLKNLIEGTMAYW